MEAVREDVADTLGKYTLKRHLATGGMAEIWLAEHTGPEGFRKEIVIKRVLQHLASDEQFTEMFLDEARLASRLTHPNIGQIHELGEADGDYFIAMEFIDGLSLEEFIEEHYVEGEEQVIPFDVAARIIADVLQALDYAHGFTDREGQPLDIVHRDVTPSNVIVSNDGVVKLVDFGVAKAAAKRSKTQTGAVKGKYAYMAPEQIESEAIDRRADLFAVGVVFYELLTGIKPFGDELAAVNQILSKEPDDPRDHREDIPEPYAQIVLKALKKDPEARYQSARAMLLDIETALRMLNSYVGQREISIIVRQARDLPIQDTEVDADSGLFSADRSSDRIMAGTLPPADRSDTALPAAEEEESSQLAMAPTAAIESPAELADETASTQRDRPTSKLVIVAASLFAAVVVAGVALTAIMTTREQGAEASEKPAGRSIVLGGKPALDEDARPGALRDEEGKTIVIETIPESRVFRGKTYVGMTPLQTTLAPGSYRLGFERNDDHKHATIEVDEKDDFQRHRLILAEIGDDDGVPGKKVKRQKKKGSGGGNVLRKIGNKIKSVF